MKSCGIVQMEVMDAGETDHLDHQSEHDEQDRQSHHSGPTFRTQAADPEGK